jgi:hypothetical protein
MVLLVFVSDYSHFEQCFDFFFLLVGWMKRTFKRQGGKTAGTMDSYWYSPLEGIKLRSMAEVKRFFKALADTDGDEKAARKLAFPKKPQKKPEAAGDAGSGNQGEEHGGQSGDLTTEHL